MGLDQKTFIIVAVVAVVGGYLYIKSKSATPQKGTGSGGGGPKHHSPTGMGRQHINVFIRDHHGHRGR